MATFFYWWLGAKTFWDVWGANSGWAAAIGALIAAAWTTRWLRKQYKQIMEQNNLQRLNHYEESNRLIAKYIKVVHYAINDVYSASNSFRYISAICTADGTKIHHRVEAFIEAYECLNNSVYRIDAEIIEAIGPDGMKNAAGYIDDINKYFEMYFKTFGENIRNWFSVFDLNDPESRAELQRIILSVVTQGFDMEYERKFGRSIRDDMNSLETIYREVQSDLARAQIRNNNEIRKIKSRLT
ncbi:hypothetical protein [Cohaesibacter marisflavi]|uniref:hypothetical protein n=1 Tax=Cohaesibacter marisflavi TaxID=655353 RepID=UPI0011134765|nr:hypothetical protein [Cohaesibacter marisflavi]